MPGGTGTGGFFHVPCAGYSIWTWRKRQNTKPRIINHSKSQSNCKGCLLKQRSWSKVQFSWHWERQHPSLWGTLTPKHHPEKLQRKLSVNTKYSRRVAARDLAKKLCSTLLQKFKIALLRFRHLYRKTLPGFWCSVAQSCLTSCDPMNFSMPGCPVHHHVLKLAQTHSIELLIPSNHPILCHAFCSCLQYFPGSGFLFVSLLFVCFPVSWLFSSGGQSIGASASVLPLNIQGWFPLGLTGWISLQPKGLSRVFSILQHDSSKRPVLQHSAFFIVELFHLHLTTGKNIALTLWALVGKVMSLSFNILSRFVTAFLPRVSIF